MIYKVGMLCKHFKGNNQLEKNIYRIEQIGVDGKDINSNLITYTGDNDLLTSKNLVVYSNIFQDNKLFVREYEDISKELDEEKKNLYKQNIKVEPLNNEEIRVINDDNFISEKRQFVLKKYQQFYYLLIIQIIRKHSRNEYSDLEYKIRKNQ